MLTVLVLEDRGLGASLAHRALRNKGQLHEDAVEQAAHAALRLGHRTTVLLKTDTAPALFDLKRGVTGASG